MEKFIGRPGKNNSRCTVARVDHPGKGVNSCQAGILAGCVVDNGKATHSVCNGFFPHLFYEKTIKDYLSGVIADNQYLP